MKSNWKFRLLALSCLTVSVAAFTQDAVAGIGLNMGSTNTSGWGLMSKQERIEHQNKIRSMKTYEECQAYVEQHHAQMVERAKEKGRKAPMKPRRDACAWLKK